MRGVPTALATLALAIAAHATPDVPAHRTIQTDDLSLLQSLDSTMLEEFLDDMHHGAKQFGNLSDGTIPGISHILFHWDPLSANVTGLAQPAAPPPKRSVFERAPLDCGAPTCNPRDGSATDHRLFTKEQAEWLSGSFCNFWANAAPAAGVTTITFFSTGAFCSLVGTSGTRACSLIASIVISSPYTIGGIGTTVTQALKDRCAAEDDNIVGTCAETGGSLACTANADTETITYTMYPTVDATCPNTPAFDCSSAQCSAGCKVTGA